MKSRSGIFKLLIFTVAFLAVWLLVAPFLAGNLIVEKPLEKADVIIVLSGSRAYVERTQTAAELYNRGISKKILLTDDGERAGWNRVERTNLKYSELARRELIKQGVSPEDIEVLEPQVSGTIYEARVFFDYFSQNKNLQNILLVTSVYHTSRTIRTFERENRRNNATLNFGIAHAPFNKLNPPPQSWWLSTSGWRTIVSEYLKIVVYWIYY